MSEFKEFDLRPNSDSTGTVIVRVCPFTLQETTLKNSEVVKLLNDSHRAVRVHRDSIRQIKQLVGSMV